MNRNKTFFICVAVSLILGSCRIFAQTAEELLPKGLQLEEVKGELEKAIQVYQTIVTQFSDNRPIAAKALYHIGLCYEKLGLKQAQKAFQEVIDKYPEQNEAVKLANEKLSLLLRAEAVIRKEDKEFNIRKVWEGTGVVLGPISPDGRFISYVDWETGDLGIFHIATGEMRRLTTNKSSWNEFVDISCWSPDGKQIVYNWYPENGTFYDLRVIGIDGSNPRVLFSDKNYIYVEPCDWSPDGSKILALLKKKDRTEITLISVADGSVHPVLEEPSFWHWTDLPSKMKFSPDGKFIVYDIRPEGDSRNHDIFVLPVAGGHGMPLAKHPADDYLLGWTPDGKRILFASARTGTYGLWTIRISGGKSQGYPELINTDIGAIRSMGFTQEGAFYYKPPKGYGHDIYIAELDPVTGRVIAAPKKIVKQFEGINMTPDFSSCGKYLAYVSLRGPFFQRTSQTIGGNVLCIRSLESGKTLEFYPELSRFGFPRWSPDNLSVFLPNWDYKKNQMGIHQIDIQNGGANPIVVTEYGLLHGHALSPDGNLIFLARSDEDRKVWKIMVKDLKSGIEKELYHVAGEKIYSMSLSPDGQLLATLSRENTVDSNDIFIRVVTTSGGEIKELHTLKEASRHLTWTSDGKYILFSSIKYGLWRISVEGGEPEKLQIEMSGEMQSLTAHPDGRRIAFSSGGSVKKTVEVWVMENFLPKETK